MTDKKKLSLSRRQALGGLGAIGLAGAGAGLGTSALFSDEESFVDNSIEAGTLDLIVEVELVDINPETQTNGLSVSDSDLEDAGDTVTINGDESSNIDGGATTGADFVLDDVKPGDWWVLKTCVKVEGNPAYVGARASDISQSENGTTEPESTTPTPDLGQKLRVRSGDRYDSDPAEGINPGTGDRKNVQQGWLSDGETPSGRPAYTPPVDISLPNGDGGIRFGDNGYDDSSAGNDDGVGPQTANPLDLSFVGTLNQNLWALTGDLGQPYSDPDRGENIEHQPYADYSTFVNPTSSGSQPGVSHDGPGVGPGFGSIRNSDDYTTVGTDNNPDTGEICTYTKYFVPAEVGNVIQGDSISYSIEYAAEQVRNNSQPSWIP